MEIADLGKTNHFYGCSYANFSPITAILASRDAYEYRQLEYGRIYTLSYLQHSTSASMSLESCKTVSCTQKTVSPPILVLGQPFQA
jgi:hypothetical protein